MEIDIENIVNQQIVAEVFEKLPEDSRNKILEKSLTKVLQNVFSNWNVESAIKADAERYMAEYILQPEIQMKIKKGVEASFDKILANMQHAFEEQINKTIKSEYHSFTTKGDETK